MDFFKKTADKPISSLMSIQLTPGPINVADPSASKPSVVGYTTATTNSGNTPSSNSGYSGTSFSVPPPPPPKNYNVCYPSSSVHGSNKSMQALNVSFPPPPKPTMTATTSSSSSALTSVSSISRTDNVGYQPPNVGYRMPMNTLLGNPGKLKLFG